jgi:hypothetical protein
LNDFHGIKRCNVLHIADFMWDTSFIRLHNDLVKNLNSFRRRTPCRVYKTCERVRLCFLRKLFRSMWESVFTTSIRSITPLYSLCKHCCKLVKTFAWRILKSDPCDCLNDKIRDKCTAIRYWSKDTMDLMENKICQTNRRY